MEKTLCSTAATAMQTLKIDKSYTFQRGYLLKVTTVTNFRGVGHENSSWWVTFQGSSRFQVEFGGMTFQGSSGELVRVRRQYGLIKSLGLQLEFGGMTFQGSSGFQVEFGGMAFQGSSGGLVRVQGQYGLIKSSGLQLEFGGMTFQGSSGVLGRVQSTAFNDKW